MRRLTVILLLGALAAGCTPYDIEEILLDRSDVSVTMKGREIYSYDPKNAQIGFNSERNEYRVFDENFLNWFEITWDEKPSSQGQKISMDIEWGTKTGFRKEKGLEFEVRKTDDSGMIWLWNSSEKIGVTIKVF